ncbi:MAG: YDG domain-containing protein [Acidimicrobiales bacterium]|nr:YDG domain-containing protein [Acidimicrobiales bacterium]
MRAITRGHVLRRALATAVALAMALAVTVIEAAPASAALSITGTGTVPYTEQDPPVDIASGVTVSGGSSYGGQHLEFSPVGTDGLDQLSLRTDGVASTVDGQVSIVGTAVYLGNGTGADPIGSIDPTSDGVDGKNLRVNFTSDFANPSLETGTLDGWTTYENRVDLGVTSLAGHSTIDTASYPTDSGGNDNDVPSNPGTYDVTVESSTASDGNRSLRLESSGMTTQNNCDVVHGPAAWSSEFQAAAGDEIYFDWRAFSGNDAYHVFGYILDSAGNQTEVLDTYTNSTSNTSWATKATTIPSTDTYRFVFVSGTYDATCGRAAGAALHIDNFRVYGDQVNDDVVAQVVQRLRYAYTGDNPPASRDVGITAQSASSGAGTGTIQVDITPVDDAPTLGSVPSSTFTNTIGDQAYATATGTLTGTDPENDPLTFAIAGQPRSAHDVAGVTYTTRQTGTYGTLHVADDGSTAFVPDAAAIDARITDDSETFTVAVDANGLTDTGTYTVNVSVPASAPGAPTGVTATPGDTTAQLSWTPPSWLGGSAISGHTVEVSTDGGATWSTATASTSADTTATVTGLTNGVEAVFRVRATNATGTSDPSAPSNAVVPMGPQSPLSVVASDITYGDTLELGVSGGSGSGEVTYTVETGPCEIDGTTLSATTAGTCTISADKAGDVAHHPASAPAVAVEVAPKTLTVVDTSVVTRPYDTTTDAELTGATLVGVEPGDDVSLADHTNGVFASPDVGTDIAVTTSMTLTGDDVAAYELVQPKLTGTVEIAPQAQLRAVIDDFVYGDSSPLASFGGSGAGEVSFSVLSGPCQIEGPMLTSSAAGICEIVATKAGDGSYEAATSESVEVTVARRPLSVEGAEVPDKVADGTRAATIEGATLEGVLDGDDVRLGDHRNGTFGSSTPGEVIPVTSRMTLAGADVDNYILAQPTLTGAILSAPTMTREDGADADEVRVFAQSESITTQLCSLQPGSAVSARLASSQRVLGTWTVGDDGCVEAELAQTLSEGTHTITFEGTDLVGDEVTMERTVEVLGAQVTRSLPVTGASVISLMLLGLALAVGGRSLTLAGRHRSSAR